MYRLKGREYRRRGQWSTAPTGYDCEDGPTNAYFTKIDGTFRVRASRDGRAFRISGMIHTRFRPTGKAKAAGCTVGLHWADRVAGTRTGP